MRARLTSLTHAASFDRLIPYVKTLSRRFQDPRVITWVFLTGSSLVVMGMSFITSIIMTHRMGQSEYGSITLGMSVSAIIGLVTRFGADRLLVRDILQHPTCKNDYITASYYVRIVIASLTLIVIFLSLKFKLLSPAWPSAVVLVYSLLACVHGLTPIEVFDSGSKIREHTLIELIANTANILGVWVLLFVFPASLRCALSVGVVRLLTTLWGCCKQFRLVRHRVTRSPWSRVRMIIRPMAARYCTVSAPSIGSTIMCQFPGLYLAWVGGPNAVAPFGIAMAMANVPALMFLQLARILNPHLVSVVRPEARRSTVAGVVFKYMTLGGIPWGGLCAIGFVTAPLIFGVLYPSTYEIGISAFQILLIWVIVGTVISYPLLQILLALGNHHAFPIGIAMGVSTSVVLSHVLVPGYGAAGAAMALLVGNTVHAVVSGVALWFVVGKMSDAGTGDEMSGGRSFAGESEATHDGIKRKSQRTAE